MLGPLQLNGKDPLSPRDRVVLEALVVQAGRAVVPDRLADALWGEEPPASWAKVVQGSIMRLRRTLGADTIETTTDGYRLTVDGDDIDARAFEHLVARGRSLVGQRDPERAVSAFERALALWRGRPFGDLDGWEPAQAEAARLDALRRAAEEALLEARLASGDTLTAVADGEGLVASDPLNEHRWALLATALYRAGRQGDALRTIQRARAVLAEQLGVSPGPELAALEQSLLQQDPALSAVTAAAPQADTRCPYRGLIPYDVDDDETFFGRDQEIATCVERLTASGFVAVVGPSGSGKSSLVRAGVAGKLRRNGHSVVISTPGPDPVGAWAATLATADPRTVVIVDQLEELVTLGAGAEAVEQFLDAIVARLHVAPVAIALRADHVGTIGVHPAFARRVERGLHLITPMTEDELRAVIEEPARAAGLRLEAGLTELLLRDVGGEPGGLPLLSFALAETWANRDGRVLTVDGYLATGGLRRAIATAAERLYEGLPANQRGVARSLFLRLVTPAPDGEAVRQRVDPRLVTADDEHRRVVDTFVRSRLLVTGDAGVEVAHEALVREWPRLRSWLDEDEDGQRLFRHLATAAAGWEAMGRPDSELYRGARLQAVVEWERRSHPDLTESERAFVDASQSHEQDEARALQQRVRHQGRQNRRLRGLLVGVAVALVLALTAGVVALVQRGRADEQRSNAVVARLVAESQQELDSHLDLAMLLAVEARRHQDTPGTRGALLTALTHNVSSERSLGFNFWQRTAFHHTNSSFLGFLPGPRRRQDDVAFSADGRILASAGSRDTSSAGGLVLVYDTSTHHEIARFPTESETFTADTSPDGRLVLASDGAMLYAFDVASRALKTIPLDTPAALVAFRPGGQQFVVTTQGSSDQPPQVQVWDTASLTRRDVRLPAPAAGATAGFAPDGSLVVVGTDNTASFVDVDTGEVRRAVALEVPLDASTNAPLDWSSLAHLTISSDGSRLAANQQNQLVYLWDLTTGKAVGDASHRPFYVTRAAFSPTAASILALSTGSGTISFYDVGTETVIGNPLHGHSGVVSNAVYSPDGRYLATTAGDGAVGLWADNGAGGLVVQPTGAGRWINSVSPDRTRAVMMTDASVDIRDVAHLEQPGTALQMAPGAKVAMGVNDNVVTHVSGNDAEVLLLANNPLRPTDPSAILFVDDARTGALRWQAPADVGVYEADVAISPDGRLVAAYYWTSGADRNTNPDRLRLWDITSSRVVADIDLNQALPDDNNDSFGWPRFTPDGQFLDVVSSHRLTRFRTADLSVVSRTAPTGTTQAQCDLAAVPGTDDLVAAGPEGLIRRWNMTTGRVVASGKSHDTTSLCGAAITPDGKTVVAMQSQGAALFDAATLQPVGVPIPAGQILETPSFTADGKQLIGNGLFDSVEWDVDPASWQAKACLAGGRNLTRAEWAEHLPGESYRVSCPQWPAGS